MKVNILVADDHEMIRSGLCQLLERELDFSVVGEANDGNNAVKLASELRPDVVVMDLHMPDMGGVEAARQTIAMAPKTKVVGLSAHSDDRSAREMFEAGAAGYLSKDSAFEELATAIRTVMSGKVYVSDSVKKTRPRNLVQPPEASRVYERVSTLSPREREVLRLLAEGQATKQAAISMHVSPKTVETHRRNLMEKLQIDNVAELTRYAITEGITEL